MSLGNVVGHGASQTARGAHAAEHIAEVAAKTNDTLGKAAQTAGTPTAQPMNVWTQTFDNTGRSAPTGLQPLMNAGTALSKVAPGLGQGMAAGAAIVSAAATIRGIAKAGVNRSTLSDVGDAAGQQASAIADQVVQLLHLSDDPTKPPPQGVLGHIAAGFGLLTSIEQMLCMPLSMIPMPALPAVRILDTDIGMPHAHMHPPNLIPPNPVPVPLPSTGPVIPIPYVSGASTVLINNMPAARCGDMGLGVFCGGFFPMFEIFLGSSSVWLEGNRAARVGTDITKHCMFSNPKSIAKSSDVPIGPMIGTTVAGSANVLIGGFPLPSLSGMAIGAAFKAMFNQLAKLAKKMQKGLGKVFSRTAAEASDDAVTQVAQKTRAAPTPGIGPDVLKKYIPASQMIEDLLAKGKLVINGDDAFKKAVEADLRKIAMTDTGKKVLDDIAKTPHSVTIEPWAAGKKGNSASGHGSGMFKPGEGTSSTVKYNPDPTIRPSASPPDAGLMHELGHGRNNAQGMNSKLKTLPDGINEKQWSNMEEYNNINNVDNPYRDEWGLPNRTGHNHLPGR